MLAIVLETIKLSQLTTEAELEDSNDALSGDCNAVPYLKKYVDFIGWQIEQGLNHIVPFEHSSIRVRRSLYGDFQLL